MVNLLPEPAQRTLRTAYYARIAALALFLAALAVFASAILLAPTYLLAGSDERAAEDYLASIQHSAAPDAGTDTALLAHAAEELSLARSYPRQPDVAATLAAVTAAVPPGVSLSQISVMPADGTAAVSVSGVAATRGDLLAFSDALKASPVLSGVSVPLSQLAQDANAAFTLSFSFIPQP